MAASVDKVDMCRYTAWISETERQALDVIAKEENCSVNFLVRSALRQFLRRRGKLVTVVTGNNGDE